MRRLRILFALTLVVGAMNEAAMPGDVPVLLHHQGRLLDAADTPVDGVVELTFSIFEAPTGGAALWSETHSGVPVSGGLFSTTLGSIAQLTADVLAPANDPGAIERYLEIQVTGDTPLTPRVRLIASPYSIASSRIAGDIETSPGKLSANGGDLEGSNDSTFLKLRLPTGNAQEGVLITTLESVRLNLSGDFDADGVPESEITQTSRATGANMAIKTKGTGAQRLGSAIGSTADSTGVRSGHDADGDGVNESEVSIIARKSMGRMKCSDVTFERAYTAEMDADSSGPSISLESRVNPQAARDNHLQGAVDVIQARLSLGSDLDNDGIDEVTLDQSTDDSRSVVEQRFRSGTKYWKFACDASNGRSSAACESDGDGDGVVDNSVSQESADSTAGVTVSSRFAAGPRQTTSLDGSFSHARMQCVTDLDADGIPDVVVASKTTATEASSVIGSDLDDDGIMDKSIRKFVNNGGVIVVLDGATPDGSRRSTTELNDTAATDVLDSDSDNDGVSDVSVGNYADASRGRIIVQKHLLEPHEAAFTVDDDGPKLELVESSIQRILVSPDSGVQQYDAAGIKTADIDADGNAYLAGNLKFGAIAGAHRIDVEGGAYCDGTNWVNASDADSKENFATVNGREILEKLNRLDITRWNYRSQPEAQHIGPTAQDFLEVFGVGSDGKSISTIDPSGIALAAIKELNRQNQELQRHNVELQRQLDELAGTVNELVKHR